MCNYNNNTSGNRYKLLIYLKVYTSNIFTTIITIATTTSEPILRTTIGDTADTSCTINTIIRVTIGGTVGTSINITTITITITIAIIHAMTGATSVINAILLIDTGAATIESEVITSEIIISITQTIRITLIIAYENQIPLIDIELAE